MLTYRVVVPIHRQGALLSSCVSYVCLTSVYHVVAFFIKKKLNIFGNRRFIPEGYIKMMAGRAKKNPTIFRHLTVTTFWGLQGVQKYNITENLVYSRGVPKNTFFQNMLLSMHIEPTYSKIKFWGPAHPPYPIFEKVKKNGAISRKKKVIL